MNQNRSSIPLLICVAAAAFGLLTFPQTVSRAVTDSFTLCTTTLLPSLFPFMVLSGVVITSGLAYSIGLRAQRFMVSVFHLPGVCFLPFLLGIIGGYPTGAKNVVNLYHSGVCSRKEAEHTLAFCNNCGPGFLISGIGYGVLGDIRYGLLLYLTHIAASCLTGFLLAPRSRPSETAPTLNPPPALPPSVAFVRSVTDSLYAFANLSAFVLCFSAITSIVQLSGISKVLSGLLPFSSGNGQWFLLGLLEITSGIQHLNTGILPEQLMLCAALTGWGGCSVHCQVLSLLQDTDLSPALYWRGKALHALLSVAIICIMLLPAEFSALGYFIPLSCTVLLLCKKSSGNRDESVL